MSTSTSWKIAGTGASVDRDTKPDWVNYSNITAESNYSYCYTSNNYSDWLRASNFGFTTTDVPSGATIEGIEVQVSTANGYSTNVDSAIYLRKTSGQVGDNKASATNWGGVRTYGATNDTWNAGLTDTDIVSSDFGVDVSALGQTKNESEAWVYYVKVRITYTEAAGGETYNETPSGGIVVVGTATESISAKTYNETVSGGITAGGGILFTIIDDEFAIQSPYNGQSVGTMTAIGGETPYNSWSIISEVKS